MPRSFTLRTRWLASAFLALLLVAAEPHTPGVEARSAMRIAIAGVAHGHIGRILRLTRENPEVELVGVFDADPALHAVIAERHQVARQLFYSDLDDMLDQAKPDAVAAFGTTFDHPRVVEAAARRNLPVMMEKPLAVSRDHAARIKAAAERTGIPVIVNYETTWYPSHAALWRLIKEQTAAGEIRKMVAMDGHQGPKEIGVGAEFLDWLTDPERNGGGALYDFGCYGANLMTWLMDDKPPLTVTAITQQIKPDVYARVDDEATIVLEYPDAQGLIQASWNWPFNRKDLEVYGASGYALADGPNQLRVRLPNQEERKEPLPAPEPAMKDELAYFTAVVRGTVKPSGLSSLENNLIVTDILEAARESARTGRTVRLSR